MVSLFREGLGTIFVFFVFITLYLVLNNLGYPVVVIWAFLIFNMFFMTIGLFLMLQVNEKSAKEMKRDTSAFWLIALGISTLAGVFLQFVFLYETKSPTPASIALAATLTTIAIAYFLMAKASYDTRMSYRR